MKTLLFILIASAIVLTASSCGGAANAPSTPSSVVTVVVTATFTPTPKDSPTPMPTPTDEPTSTPEPSPTPVELAGIVPRGWKDVKIAGTSASFALPGTWEIRNSQAGLVEFTAASSGPSGPWGSVVFLEEVPASRLSLLRTMTDATSYVDILGMITGITAELSDDGRLSDPPLHWAEYKRFDKEAVAIGAFVTTKGTIVIAMQSDENARPGATKDRVIEIARTMSFSAPIVELE